MSSKGQVFFYKKYRLIENSKLFNLLTNEQYSLLFEQSKIISFNASAPIINAGEMGDEMYIVYSGVAKVFILDKQGNEVVLARLEEGNYFGEQSLLLDGLQKRNAFVTALTDVKLIEISSHHLHESIKNDESLSRELVQLNKSKLIDHLRHRAPLNAGIVHDALSQLAGNIIYASEGDVIFSKGEKSDDVYFIIEGRVKIELSPTASIYLDSGQLFGELGVLRSAGRAGTAKVEEDAKLLKVPGVVFKNLYDSLPDVRTFVSAMQRIYAIPTRGKVTVSKGEISGVFAIQTHFEIKGRVITALHAVNQDLFSMESDQSSYSRKVCYESGLEVIRELKLSEDKIVGIKCIGEWPGLGYACGLLLDGLPVSENQIALFCKEGCLSIEEDNAVDPVLCYCMGSTRSELQNFIAAGVDTVDGLAGLTGAGTVCGGCRPKIGELLGKETWSLGVMEFERVISVSVRVFRVQVKTQAFAVNAPGQFINIQFLIDGCWVERSFTVIASDPMRKSYDIAVENLSAGYVTPWLFSQNSELIVRVSNPEGYFILDKKEAKPTVFFAAGIGVTPAHAYLYDLNKNQWPSTLYLDYSTHSPESACFLKELQHMAGTSDKFDFKLRTTSVDGRLNEQGVLDVVDQFPGANFHICGGESYRNMVEATLKKAGVSAARIRHELFKLPGL